jgi:hypothetical protein
MTYDTAQSNGPAVKGVTDRVLHTSLLGVRFWDPVLRRTISDGLKVSAYPAMNPRLRSEAVPNPSGVYGFHNLPGLRDFALREIKRPEQQWKDVDPRTPPLHGKRYIVEVTDNRDWRLLPFFRDWRFLPFLLNVTVPVQEGIWPWSCALSGSSPDTGSSFVPLFSSPTRSIPAGMAAIRAELRDPNAKQPAAWALLEARYQGVPLARGLADAKGRIVLIFPYPEPARLEFSPPVGSPPRERSIPLRMQQWRIDLQAFYTPDPNPPAIPDLEIIACTQPPAKLWEEETLNTPLTGTAITFGDEKIIRTKKAGGETLPELYITSAVSPP